jgi:hypothetical protein
MRVLAIMAAFLLLDGCAGGLTDVRMFPEGGHGAYKPDAIYHTNIDGQGIEVETWTDRQSYRSAASTESSNAPDPNPALAEAAQRVAALNCPAGYRITNKGGDARYYSISYVCTS